MTAGCPTPTGSPTIQPLYSRLRKHWEGVGRKDYKRQKTRVAALRQHLLDMTGNLYSRNHTLVPKQALYDGTSRRANMNGDSQKALHLDEEL